MVSEELKKAWEALRKKKGKKDERELEKEEKKKIGEKIKEKEKAKELVLPTEIRKEEKKEEEKAEEKKGIEAEVARPLGEAAFKEVEKKVEIPRPFALHVPTAAGTLEQSVSAVPEKEKEEKARPGIPSYAVREKPEEELRKYEVAKEEFELEFKRPAIFAGVEPGELITRPVKETIMRFDEWEGAKIGMRKHTLYEKVEYAKEKKEGVELKRKEEWKKYTPVQ